MDVPQTDSLQYVATDKVHIAGMRAEGMEIRAREGRFLGDLEGFLVDPVNDSLHYLVVRPKASVPKVTLASASGARVDLYDRAIRLDVDSLNTDAMTGPLALPDCGSTRTS